MGDYGGGGGTTVVQAPTAPNYQESMKDILTAQVEMAPKVYESELKYQPLYGALQAAQQAFQTQQSLDIARQAYPQVAEIEANYNAANRAAELTSLQQTLPAYQQAFNALTPGYAQAIQGAGQLAQQSMQNALIRPQLTAFESGVRDPYGSGLTTQQFQPFSPSLQQPQTLQQPMSAQQQVVPAQQPVFADSKIQYNQALEDRFKKLSEEMRSIAPGTPPASPPSVIAPKKQGFIPKVVAALKTQTLKPLIDAEQEKYKTTLADFNAKEAEKNIKADQYLSKFSAANALTAQQTNAAAPQTQRAPGPVSAVSGPRAMVGQMQGPAAPAGALRAVEPTQQQPYSSLKDIPAGGYINAVQNFAPANVAAGAGMPQEAGYLNAVPSPGLAAIAAGQVPGGARMAGTTPASTAAASAGAVPEATATANAMQIEAAQRMAGVVPTAQGMQQAQTAAAAAQTAGAVPATANLQRVAGPKLASNIQRLDRNAVDQYIGSMPGMGDYANMLAQQSQANLAAGKSLTAEEQRMADQSARAAYAARGTALGPQAVNAEILNRADVANQRYQQRLQNAAQAAGTIQAIYQPALQQSLQRQQLGIDYGLGLQQQQFGQAQARDVLNQQTQAQRYAQAMGTQGAGFGQAQARDAAAQSLQAQRYAQAMGFQTTGFEQAQARDAMAAQLQAQRYGQAMGTQGTGFQQAQAQDVFGRDTQQQQYAQLMGTQGAAFQQAGAKEGLAQQLLQGAQAQQFEQAMNREQLGAGLQQTAFNQALQRGQAEQQRLQAGTALQAGQASLGMGALGQLQSAQAPILQAFYKQPILQGQESQAQQMAMLMQQQAGPQYFNPESQTGMGSIYGAYNAQMNLAGAQAQANAAAKAGRSSMFGSLGGSLIGAAARLLPCWVAREVYGNDNPKWMQFREWLLRNADDDFLNAYIQHGPKVAEFISDKPELKNMIRSWMDSKIS